MLENYLVLAAIFCVCDCGAIVLCILPLKQGANEAHPQRTLSGKATHTYTHTTLYTTHMKSDIVSYSYNTCTNMLITLYVAASVWRNVAHAKRKT